MSVKSLFCIGWACIVFAILVSSGPVLALAFVGIGLVIASWAKWVDK